MSTEVHRNGSFAGDLTAKLQLAEADRDAAQSLIGDIRAIVSRPGKKLELVGAKLIEYKGDYDLRARRIRARE